MSELSPTKVIKPIGCETERELKLIIDNRINELLTNSHEIDICKIELQLRNEMVENSGNCASRKVMNLISNCLIANSKTKESYKQFRKLRLEKHNSDVKAFIKSIIKPYLKLNLLDLFSSCSETAINKICRLKFKKEEYLYDDNYVSILNDVLKHNYQWRTIR